MRSITDYIALKDYTECTVVSWSGVEVFFNPWACMLTHYNLLCRETVAYVIKVHLRYTMNLTIDNYYGNEL